MRGNYLVFFLGAALLIYVILDFLIGDASSGIDKHNNNDKNNNVDNSSKNNDNNKNSKNNNENSEMCCGTVLCDLRDEVHCSPSFYEFFMGWRCEDRSVVDGASATATVRSRVHEFLHSGGRNRSSPALESAMQHYFSFQYHNHAMFRERKNRARRERRRPNSRAVQQLLASPFLREAVPRRQPTLYLVGGGGGAGKSTLVAHLHARGLLPAAGPAAGVVYVNHDIIMERDRRYLRLVRRHDYGAARLTHDDAAQVGQLVCQQALEAGADLVLEGTLSQPAQVLALMAQARSRNYTVRLFGVAAPRVDQAVQRVLRRAAATARFVPPPLLLQHHRLFAAHWPRYCRLAHQFQLFEASDNAFAEMVRGGSLAGNGRQTNGGGRTDVLLPDRYRQFAINQLVDAAADSALLVYARYQSPGAVARFLQQQDHWWWLETGLESAAAQMYAIYSRLRQEAVDSVCPIRVL